MKKLKPLSRIVIALSALMMITAYYVPLWQILMWAPQYPEGLEMKIWVDNITGDVKIISALNHYIGMKHIEVSMFPEFGYMIYIIGAVIAAGLLTAVFNRKVLLLVYTFLIVACGVAALIDFYIWGYNYGHNLDPTAPIVVPGMSYQPPLIGTKQLLNFTAYSGPDTGGWVFLVIGIVVIGVLVYELYTSRVPGKVLTPLIAAFAMITLASCSIEPQPLQYGKDACHACKMTLMDNRFGAEIITDKGKVYKFDDVNCMLNFLHSKELKVPEQATILVIDFSKTETLIDARAARYVKSEAIRSPMASNIAAFETEVSLLTFNDAWHGKILDWSELQQEYK
jgi:copper chaperone NosL